LAYDSALDVVLVAHDKVMVVVFDQVLASASLEVLFPLVLESLAALLALACTIALVLAFLVPSLSLVVARQLDEEYDLVLVLEYGQA